MCKSLTLSLCAMIALAGLLISQPAFAETPDDVTDARPDPQALAQRCVEHATKRADVFLERNQHRTERTVAAIKRMTANGHADRAKQLAKTVVADMQQHADHSIGHIKNACERCTTVLNRHDQTDLAQRVDQACKTQVQRIKRGEAAGIKAIRDALGDDADGA